MDGIDGYGAGMRPGQITIGARLRILRRWRSKTQEELAGLAGVTQGYISLVEKGLRPLDRRSIISALAGALEVSETDLVGGPHLSRDRVQSDPHKAIPPLRISLQANSLTSPAVGRARPLGQLRDEVFRTIEPLRRVCDYVGVGFLLPAVIDELYWHAAAPADEAAYRSALESLTEACVIASAVTKELGYLDLAFVAAQRAQETAALLDDPVQKGKADFMWLLTQPRRVPGAVSSRPAERAADNLEPHVHDPLGLQVLGMLTLTASLSAAVAQDSDAAVHWLDQAAEVATRIPDEPTANWQCFSAANVDMWRVSVAVERGEPGGAILGMAGKVNLGLLEPRASRRAGFLSDVGRGLAREAKMRDEAIRWLRRAEDAAPQRIRNSAAVRDTVTVMLNQSVRAAGGRELRGMASRMGIPA
jgi:transcriptional regulator with XRE-family HTH domain